MKAVLRKIRISPDKANLVAGIVRGKNVKEALDLLKFMPKKAAKILYKVINSAAYNAKNNFKQNINDLYITTILVTKGPTFKRSIPTARGRSLPIRKRTSHITVEVGVKGVDSKSLKSVHEQPVEAKVKASAPAKVSADKKVKVKTTEKKAEKKVEKKAEKKTVKKSK